MKLREWKEIKNYSKEELIAKLESIQRNLFELKLKNRMLKLKNTKEIKNLRKDIARIKTLLWQKYGIKK